MNITSIPLNNPGIVIADIPKTVWTNLKNSLDFQMENRNKFAALKFAVHPTVMGIEESFQVSLPNDCKDFIKEFSLSYYDHYNMSHNNEVMFQKIWLNVQKKHEYRPYHQHAFDSSLSFVVYYKVPFKIEDEDSHPNHNGADRYRNGRIEFMWYDLTGVKQFLQIPADKSYEGKILIFPSPLYHMVYPFYSSDDYRISLAGNIKVK